MIKISQNDDHSVLFDEEDGRKWRRRTGKWWFVITATFLKNFSKPGRYAAKSTFRLFTLALHLQLVLQFWFNVESLYFRKSNNLENSCLVILLSFFILIILLGNVYGFVSHSHWSYCHFTWFECTKYTSKKGWRLSVLNLLHTFFKS